MTPWSQRPRVMLALLCAAGLIFSGFDCVGPDPECQVPVGASVDEGGLVCKGGVIGMCWGVEGHSGGTDIVFSERGCAPGAACVPSAEGATCQFSDGRPAPVCDIDAGGVGVVGCAEDGVSVIECVHGATPAEYVFQVVADCADEDPGARCLDGRCLVPCGEGLVEGASICDGDQVKVCELASDGLLHLRDGERCAADAPCDMGACTP